MYWHEVSTAKFAQSALRLRVVQIQHMVLKLKINRWLYTQAAESKQSHFHLQLLCTKKMTAVRCGEGVVS